ncbi:Two-component sensor histidine kinase, contains HisKA and HATPase domains [Devosia sp. YR412]|uniref:sensor histidine kinase n=1 Tax=Devosia sp. YR412 TaxID=1881030 RepID=UPI0008AFA8AC|nr:sensor histidine kinase [Devosia sp. YR412]SEP60670.1 Two-component sensor histidine kinase, contains HisKA and HATPase domains [Devosia sp. YR412]
MRAPSLSLSQRLLLLTAVALLPALAILGFNEFALRKAREAEVHDYALRLSELAALEMERILTGAAALMVAVANAPVVQDVDSGCEVYLTRLGNLLPQVTLINITDLDGNSICANSDAAEDLAPALSQTVRTALHAEFFRVGEYVETSRGPGLLLGTQRTDADGTINGAVLATIGLDYLGKLIKERPALSGSAMTIADRNGVYLAREPQPENYVGTQIADSFMPRLLGENSGTLQVLSADGTERIIGYQPATKGLGLYVSAGLPVADSMAPINEATLRGVVLAVIGGLVALLLALSFGRQFIRRPVLRLLLTIRAWRSGDHAARTGMVGKAEFHQVGEAIDALLDELTQRQIAQQEAEQHRDLLARELDHRIKNLLATVQAVARQSFRNSGIAEASLQAFYGRLAVMADAHKLLTATHSESASVGAVVQTAIEPFFGREQQRFAASGPEVELHAKAALSLAMALHELCTNASKYGALSNETGTVTIGWALTEGHKLILTWREAGGPEVVVPADKGFGSRMIERALAADLGATVAFDYAPGGLTCTIIAAETALVDRQDIGSGPFQPVRAVMERG